MSSVNHINNSFFKKNQQGNCVKDSLEVKSADLNNSSRTDIYKSNQLYFIIIDRDMEFCIRLQRCLEELFPHIHNISFLNNLESAKDKVGVQNHELIFAEADIIENINSLHHHLISSHIISISDNPVDAIIALRDELCGFISKPLDKKEVKISVLCALKKLHQYYKKETRSNWPQLPHNKLLGVPTIEGMEFLNTKKIVRCEGLQKCTRIITIEKSDIVSSYNIGEFKKLLKNRGFFSCHKSHLINLKFVRKYTREGFIFFNANSKPVPLARRRKPEFLKQMNHL